MAIMGAYGSAIVFGVLDPYNDWGSRTMIRPEDMKRKTSARWKDYPLIRKKPKTEFCGPELDEFSLSVQLSADYGITPLAVIESLRSHVRRGIADYLVIGGRYVGDNPYVITDMSETWDEVWNQGQLFKATVELSFKESV